MRTLFDIHGSVARPLSIVLFGLVSLLTLVAATSPQKLDGSVYPSRAHADHLDAAADAAEDAKDPRWVFQGLGAWVDLFDLSELRARPTIARMKRHGVRTLYLQTGRSNTKHAVDPRVGPWLAYAHKAGIKVVGWYLPYYENPDSDVYRTFLIKQYRWHGHRFDGLGIDIEYKDAVKRNGVWNRRVVAVGDAVKRRVGRNYPVAAIPPTPLQMRVAPGTWAGFPWQRMARSSDAVLLMSYWSDRSGCPRIRKHCAYEFTRLNVELTRRYIRKDIPVHVIGGIGDSISAKQLRAFVRGAAASGADGASIYDVVTTEREWWPTLSKLKTLGR